MVAESSCQLAPDVNDKRSLTGREMFIACNILGCYSTVPVLLLVVLASKSVLADGETPAAGVKSADKGISYAVQDNGVNATSAIGKRTLWICLTVDLGHLFIQHNFKIIHKIFSI